MNDESIGLVLSGGGARAAYQVGALSFIGERVPSLRCPIITGVSAGAINAGVLASHAGGLRDAGPDLQECWFEISIDQVFDAKGGSLVSSAARWAWKLAASKPEGMPRSLLDTTPLRHYLERKLKAERIRENIDRGALRALGLTATCYETGETITFVDAQSDVAMWKRVKRRAVAAQIGVDHLMASSAIPLVFPAIRIGQAYYGDGSVRLTAPLAPAIHLGAGKLLVIAIRYSGTEVECGTASYPTPSLILGRMLNAVFLDALDADIERLTRINDLLGHLTPEAAPKDLRPIRFLVLRPSVDLASLATRSPAQLPPVLRFVGKRLGLGRADGANFLSYLLFEEPYISQLVQIGYQDAKDHWDDVERFLDSSKAD